MKRIAAVLLVALVASPAFAYRSRKQSTTSYPNCAVMRDSGDHTTEKTGLTITCKRTINGGASASCSGSVTEIDSTNFPGLYCLAGNATDRATIGVIVYRFSATGADPNQFEVEVKTNDPFLEPDTSSTIAAVTTVTTTTTATTCTNLTNAPTNGDFTAAMKTSLNASTPASVTGSVGSISGVSFPTNFGFLSVNGSGQVDAIKIAGTTQTGLDLGGNYTAARALKLDNLDAAVSTRLAISGYTAPLSAGATANALWDELTSGHSTSGSFGKLLKDQLDTNVGSRMATSALPTNFSFLSISGGGAVTLTAAYDAAKTAAQAGNTMTLTSAYDAAKTAAQASDIPSAAAVSSAVWSDTLADYSGIIGSTAEALAASAAGASPVSIASAVWNSSATGPSTWTVHNSAGELFALKLALISSGAITVSSPVAANGVDLNIAPGTAYMTTPHSRAATFGPISDVDLTGATVTLTIVSGNATVLSSAGSVVAAGTSEQYVVFQLTALNTALLSRIGTGAYSHQVNATWATDTPTQPIRVLSGKVNTDPKYFE